MGAYIIRRILIAIPVLFGITVIAFGILSTAPDQLGALIDPEARAHMTPAQVEAVRRDLGLDGPPYVRYARWLGLQPIVAVVTGEKAVPGVLEGNLGYTLSTRLPVVQEIVPRIGPTLLLMIASVVLAVLIGIPFGVISAVKQYGKLDYLLTSVTMVLISTPTFVLGLILIYLLGVSLRLLPIGGMQTLGKPFSYADLAGHMAMPVLILGFAYAAPLMRYTRASMLEVLSSEYVTTARAKGLVGPGRAGPARPAQRADPDHHGRGPAAARPHRGSDHHGAGLLVAGHGPAGRSRRIAARSLADDGHRPAHRGGGADGEHHHRRRVHVRRPEDPPCQD